MHRPDRDWQPHRVDGVPDGMIVFDGVCVFCSSWVQFVIARDRMQRFRFTPVQSAYGSALARRLGISIEGPETNAVVFGGRAYFKSDAAIEVLSRLPRWSWARILRWAPRPIRDGLYDWIARRRYRLFGRTEACMAPPPELAARFVFEQPPPVAR
ncbi:MAG TPA: DCC1-like thiol-disulfide oxidoreductase family protein [Stellaceae bacterium]